MKGKIDKKRSVNPPTNKIKAKNEKIDDFISRAPKKSKKPKPPVKSPKATRLRDSGIGLDRPLNLVMRAKPTNATRNPTTPPLAMIPVSAGDRFNLSLITKAL
ncbi:MAG: hypothetical protein N2110_03640 [Flavobacteriales bacterium]|nr:hypothetical protein [Flavobacteriales bacterium]